jgi:hypothetical protein
MNDADRLAALGVDYQQYPSLGRTARDQFAAFSDRVIRSMSIFA